ncbi:MAG: Phosphoadenosine phosphosulfate reductase family protein [Candidatus Acidoferrum typicum]|nr:Phosphoadenosine phosphosulfate reductase family protein [Candidatus Acidoferrum typicum]
MSNGDERGWRHILALSGGKDSSALAIYMKERIPEMEYVFCDTAKELVETYEYLDRLEVFLEKPVVRLKNEGMGFDDLLKMRRGFLPSPQMRWCTEYLKIKPYEKYIGDDKVISYVGIRADEGNRKRYISTKPNIIAKYPFVEDGIRHKDVLEILNTTYVGGKPIGLPKYYEWRSRSGCYFCFYQQRREWVGLLETHPELFRKAMDYEKEDQETGERYSWVQGESLAELAKPERVAQIKREFEERVARKTGHVANSSLREVFSSEAEEQLPGCTICHL